MIEKVTWGGVLTKERTEYGKAIRKKYESHEMKLQRKEISRWVVRRDNCSNTITTVLKDNYLLITEK